MSRQYGALSGLAIVLIVLNHAIHFGLQVSPAEGASLKLLIALQALGAFAVPTFLFISGAFLAYAAREITPAFMRSSLARIFWPYLVWSAVFFAVLAFTAGRPEPITAYVKSLLVGYPYHFVPLLVFCYLASPLIVRAGRRYAIVLITAVAVYQVLLLALRTPPAAGLPPAPEWARLLRAPVLATPMSDWAIYFPLGMVLSLHAGAIRPALSAGQVWFGAAAGSLFAIGLLNAYEVVWAPWARFAAPLPLMFLLPLVDRRSIPAVGALEAIGRRSYGVYLSHFVVVTLAVVAIRELAPAHSVAAVWVITAALLASGIGIPLLLMNVTARVPFARAIYRYVFGGAPRAPATVSRAAESGSRQPAVASR